MRRDQPKFARLVVAKWSACVQRPQAEVRKAPAGSALPLIGCKASALSPESASLCNHLLQSPTNLLRLTAAASLTSDTPTCSRRCGAVSRQITGRLPAVRSAGNLPRRKLKEGGRPGTAGPPQGDQRRRRCCDRR